MCLKQALHVRKQLLWRSFTEAFHENDKVEVKLRCFEVEFFTQRRYVPAYTLLKDISFTHCIVSVSTQFGGNLNFKLT